MKAYSEIGGRKTYYKLSNFDRERGVIGHECANEIVVDRLLDILDVPHLHYQLIHADVLVGEKNTRYGCVLRRTSNGPVRASWRWMPTGKVSIWRETPLAFCARNGWDDYIYQMLVVDFLILNRDRHGANIEVLRNSRKRTIHLAPLFDHGLSLLYSCASDKAALNYDVMGDRQVNNYIGSRSTWENLRLIPKEKLPQLRPLKENDKATLLAGLDGVLSPVFQEKIWEMIWKRWCAYEDFCNQG